MTRYKNHLSLVSKLDGVDSFIVPLSTCQDFCKYYDFHVSYWLNNPHKDYKNPKLIYLKNKNKKCIEIPTVAYYGTSNELLSTKSFNFLFSSKSFKFL